MIGDITGGYIDAAGVVHGFTLIEGRYRTVDDPHAGTAAGQGIALCSINNHGVAVAALIDAHGDHHGVLDRNGRLSALIDDPSAANGSGLGTETFGINDTGEVAGQYFDAGGVLHGFTLIRGRFTTIDDPKGVTGSSVQSVADTGELVGYYTDASSAAHGFVFFPDES